MLKSLGDETSYLLFNCLVNFTYAELIVLAAAMQNKQREWSGISREVQLI